MISKLHRFSGAWHQGEYVMISYELIRIYRCQEPHPITVHRELYLSMIFFFVSDLKEQNDAALFVNFSIILFGAVQIR